MTRRFIVLAIIIAVAGAASPGHTADRSWQELNLKVADLYLAGKDSEAAQVAQAAVQRAQKQFGKEHPYVASSLNDLGEIYRTQGKLSEAEVAYNKSIVLLEKVPGPEKLVIIYPMAGLAQLYMSQGKYAEAELIYQRLVSKIEKSPTRQQELLSYALEQLAGISLRQGKYDAAGELMTRAFNTRVDDALIPRIAGEDASTSGLMPKHASGGGRGGGGGGAGWVGPVVNTILSVGNALSQISAQAAYEQAREFDRVEREAETIKRSGDDIEIDTEPVRSTRSKRDYSPPVDKEKFRGMIEQAKKKYQTQEARPSPDPKPPTSAVNTEEIKKRQLLASQLLASVERPTVKPPVQDQSAEAKRREEAQKLLSAASKDKKQQSPEDPGKDKRQQQAQILLSRTAPPPKENLNQGSPRISPDRAQDEMPHGTNLLEGAVWESGHWTDRLGRIWEPNMDVVKELYNLETYKPPRDITQNSNFTKDFVRNQVAKSWDAYSKYWDSKSKERDSVIKDLKERIERFEKRTDLSPSEKKSWIDADREAIKRGEEYKAVCLKNKQLAYEAFRRDMNRIDSTGDIWKVAGGTSTSTQIAQSSPGGGGPPSLPEPSRPTTLPTSSSGSEETKKPPASLPGTETPPVTQVPTAPPEIIKVPPRWPPATDGSSEREDQKESEDVTDTGGSRGKIDKERDTRVTRKVWTPGCGKDPVTQEDFEAYDRWHAKEKGFRTDPANEDEQEALNAAKAGEGMPCMPSVEKWGDDAYKKDRGRWEKMEYVVKVSKPVETFIDDNDGQRKLKTRAQRIVIHYWVDKRTGLKHGFKFKDDQAKTTESTVPWDPDRDGLPRTTRTTPESWEWQESAPGPSSGADTQTADTFKPKTKQDIDKEYDRRRKEIGQQFSKRKIEDIIEDVSTRQVVAETERNISRAAVDALKAEMKGHAIAMANVSEQIANRQSNFDKLDTNSQKGEQGTEIQNQIDHLYRKIEARQKAMENLRNTIGVLTKKADVEDRRAAELQRESKELRDKLSRLPEEKQDALGKLDSWKKNEIAKLSKK